MPLLSLSLRTPILHFNILFLTAQRVKYNLSKVLKATIDKSISYHLREQILN